MNPVELKVLDDAGDESTLWQLPWPLRQVDAEVTREVYPATSIDESRAALRSLVQDGLVSLYELETKRDLDLEEALAAIDDHEAWLVPPERRRVATNYALALTESGLDAYRSAFGAKS